MTTKLLLISCCLSLVWSAAAAAAKNDISGTWVSKMTTPMGEIENVYRFKVTGNKIEGSVTEFFGDAPIIEGTIIGDKLEFTTLVDFFGEQRRMTIKGTIVGDELHLTPSMPGPGGPPTGGGPGGPPPGGLDRPPPGAVGPPGGGPPPFARDMVAKRGTPSQQHRQPVDFKSLPKLELPPEKDLSPNGLALTPPMGWNSWNKFHTKLSDQLVREIAEAMVASGMREAGYTYINIDDGWQGDRDVNGVLQANTNFPNMKALADYVHGQGLKLGIYSSPGPRTCAGFEGSYGHEEQDARTWAEWGIDYLKYDWCSAARVFTNAAIQMRPVYQKMAEALRATGRSIVYSICQYGRAQVWSWAPNAGGNLWRTTGDIFDNWQSMAAIGFGQDTLADYAGPGHWNDPDMLEIGNGGMSEAEYRTHFSVWALLASPLIAGNDIRAMPPETKEILLNREVIAVDQDPLGKQGRRVARETETEIWRRPLADGGVALGLFNRGNSKTQVTIKWADVGISNPVQVRDLWAHKDLGTTGDHLTVEVESHGVVLLRVAK